MEAWIDGTPVLVMRAVAVEESSWQTAGSLLQAEGNPEMGGSVAPQECWVASWGEERRRWREADFSGPFENPPIVGG